MKRRKTQNQIFSMHVGRPLSTYVHCLHVTLRSKTAQKATNMISVRALNFNSSIVLDFNTQFRR